MINAIVKLTERRDVYIKLRESAINSKILTEDARRDVSKKYDLVVVELDCIIQELTLKEE